MKQDDKGGQFKKFVGKVQDQIKELFVSYKQEVDRRNEQSGGILYKNDKSQKIYANLLDVSKELKTIEKQLHQCDKLRKERRELFDRRTARFSNALGQLMQDKNIKIKINPHLQKLVAKSKQIATQVQTAIRLFKTQSIAICGKSYDYKPMIEKAFMELSELGFLWQNLANFQSVTNQSVKEIFLPIQYKPSDFQKLQGELIKVWSETLSRFQKVQKISVAPPPPPEIIEKIQKTDLQLAHQCLFGFTRSQQVAKAIQIYQKEAAKSTSDPTVFNVLGILHQQGKGYSKDLNKAFKYFMRSAQKGDPQGLYKVGQYLQKGLLNFKHYFDGLYANRDAEVRGGIEYYQKAAAKGHLDALTDLGFIYEKGVLHQGGNEYFIEPHPDHAKKYYQKAKEKQFPRAYNNLGNLLICQNSISTNLSQNANLQKGIKYLTKARDLGCPKAPLNLGKCYFSGTGVAINLQKARMLFKQAAELGQIQGRLEYLRSYIGTNLEEEQIMNELHDTARMVLIENRNNPEALFLMGLLQEKGIGIAANKQSSYHYIASAARLEYPPALTRLGDYYYSGYYVDKNYENARMLYEKAAQKEDSQAFLNLALMQEKGLVPMGSTFGEIQQLYKRAQDLGNTNALLIRGLKRQGNISRNEKILKAAEKGNYQALKILTHHDSNFMSPANRTENEFKKISTFYMKETLPVKRKFDSLL